jgi:hypothetical protein
VYPKFRYTFLPCALQLRSLFTLKNFLLCNQIHNGETKDNKNATLIETEQTEIWLTDFQIIFPSLMTINAYNNLNVFISAEHIIKTSSFDNPSNASVEVETLHWNMLHTNCILNTINTLLLHYTLWWPLILNAIFLLINIFQQHAVYYLW